jgi:uncharacterized protein
MELHQQYPTANSPEQSGMTSPGQSPTILAANPVIRKKPRVWTVFVAFVIVAIVGAVISGIYMAVASILTSGPSASSPEKIARVLENPHIMIPSFAIMGVVALIVTGICSALSPERIRDRLSLHPSRFGAQGYVAAIFVVSGISMAVGQILSPLTDTNSPTLKLLDKHLRTTNTPWFVLAAVIIGGFAPIAEEVLFRGYMQTRLRNRWGAIWAIGITASLFGAFHADPVQSPFAFLIGLSLGYVAVRMGSIRPAIVCHAVNNLISVLGSKFAESDQAQPTSWPAVAVGIIFAIAGIAWFRRLEQKPSPPV